VTEIEDLIARAIVDTGINLTPQQRRSLVMRVAAELRANADAVRIEMDHIVWGMVR